MSKIVIVIFNEIVGGCVIAAGRRAHVPRTRESLLNCCAATPNSLSPYFAAELLLVFMIDVLCTLISMYDARIDH